MRKFLFLLFPAFAALSVLNCSGDSDMPCATCNSSSSAKYKSCDIEDYGTIDINGQVWMSENFNCYFPYSKCYDDELANCNKYGRLYNWATAKIVCPKDWHLPTEADWLILINHVESDSECSGCAGKHLKSKYGWKADGNGQDTYDFSAMPGGGYSDDFLGIGDRGTWWSADEDNDNNAYGQSMSLIDENSSVYADKNSLFSVRCLRD